MRPRDPRLVPYCLDCPGWREKSAETEACELSVFPVVFLAVLNELGHELSNSDLSIDLLLFFLLPLEPFGDQLPVQLSAFGRVVFPEIVVLAIDSDPSQISSLVIRD